MINSKRKNTALLTLRKTGFISLLAVPALLLIFPALDFAFQVHMAFPAGDLQSNIFAFDDKFLKGSSQIESFSLTRKEVELYYRLRPGAPLPSVFINFLLGTSEKPLDLTGIRSVSIDIEEATPISVLLYFQTFVPGISLPGTGLENGFTLRTNQYVLELSPGVQHYTVEIEKFTTNLLWLASMKIDPDSLPQEDYKRVINFSIMLTPFGTNYVLDKPEHIVVKKVTFNQKLSGMNLAILIGVVLFYTVFFILQLARGFRCHLLQTLERRPLEVTTYYEQDLSRIKEFLKSHYCDPGISTHLIYQKLGIPKARVSELLNREYHLTCKQLINKMRIEEAKRLLTQTDLRITDIALNLGFNNITYFNHLFKASEGQAPSEVRNCKHRQELQAKTNT